MFLYKQRSFENQIAYGKEAKMNFICKLSPKIKLLKIYFLTPKF